jgi:hypothetical protein
MSEVIIIKLLVMHFLHLLPTWAKYPGDRLFSHLLSKENKINVRAFSRII